jgi:hypothetical protein
MPYQVPHTRYDQINLNQDCYRISIEGKNLGPAKPWAMMLWTSILPPLYGLQSLISMKRPDLLDSPSSAFDLHATET